MQNELQNQKGIVINPDENSITSFNENPAMLSSDTVFALAQQVDKRIEAINKIIAASIKITTNLDWVIIGGKPYLQESGATKVARLWGVSWQIDVPKKEVKPDGHYLYTYKGRFHLSGAIIEAEGARSSSDEFFTGSDKKDKDGNIIALKKTADEIDERDVKLAAYTNCINNGIKRLIPGLRNIEIETLKAQGLNTDKMKGYGFNSSAPKEMSGEGQDQKQKIMDMLKESCGGDGEKIKKMLKKYTSFTKSDGTEFPGHDDINKVSEKAMNVTYGKVKKAYDEWKDRQADGEGGDGSAGT